MWVSVYDNNKKNIMDVLIIEDKGDNRVQLHDANTDYIYKQYKNQAEVDRVLTLFEKAIETNQHIFYMPDKLSKDEFQLYSDKMKVL